MKQVMQDLEKGETRLVDVPCPTVMNRHLLINTTHSLVSVGTERMLVEFGKANMLEKVRQQPDKAKMVAEKIKTDGLFTTIDAVRSKLAQPIPLGYCNVGVVKEVGKDISEFNTGDRVVSNGYHADVVRVPKNLCARIPDNVSDEEAAFTVVASIGLQGIRLLQPAMGESVVVVGVGLIGLLTVQLLIAHGCRVMAVDFDDNKLRIAQQFGATVCNPGAGEDPVMAGISFSRGTGVDGVIITASTKSNDPVTQAAKMCRKRGRIVLVGVTGLELSRADFYEKELSFQVSCSYGPGRYDPNYEERGNDYPIGFVRWTEQRNFIAILDLMASGKLDVKPLISHRFGFDKAVDAYDLLVSDKGALGILLQYGSPQSDTFGSTVTLRELPKFNKAEAVIGVVGAGNYASRVLIPSFKKVGAQLFSISTSSGMNAAVHGEKAGLYEATTDTLGLIRDSKINTVVIATRHDTHAILVSESLKAGKNVFVEKPLAINDEELENVQRIYEEVESQDSSPRIMVGFNRRFSPQVRKIKSLIEPINEPKSFIMTVNAGSIPADHWTQDINIGGGRIIGEACHFIDLMRFLAGSEIVSVQARRMGDVDALQVLEDKAAILLGFADGFFGTINYLANGASALSKERIEVFVAGRVLLLDNFVKLKGYGWKNFNKENLWKQDKGQIACIKAFLNSIKNGEQSPIAPREIFEVARVSIEIAKQLRSQ